MIVKDFTLPDAYHMRASADKFAPSLGSLLVHDERNTDMFERTYVLSLGVVGMMRVECSTTREGIENLRNALNSALMHAETTGTLATTADLTVPE